MTRGKFIDKRFVRMGGYVGCGAICGCGNIEIDEGSTYSYLIMLYSLLLSMLQFGPTEKRRSAVVFVRARQFSALHAGYFSQWKKMRASCFTTTPKELIT